MTVDTVGVDLPPPPLSFHSSTNPLGLPRGHAGYPQVQAWWEISEHGSLPIQL